MERTMSEDKSDEGYEAGYRDAERAERELRAAAAVRRQTILDKASPDLRDTLAHLG